MKKLLPFITQGSRSNPLVVFLHGFMGDKYDWQPIMKAMSSDYHCLAFDLPGHGDAKEQIDDVDNISTLCHLLYDTFIDKNLQSINLVGYSMGGRIALSFAEMYPKMLNSLVLESTRPGIQDPNEVRARRLLDDHWISLLQYHGLPAFIEQWYQQPLFASLAQKKALLHLQQNKVQANDAKALATALYKFSPANNEAQWECISHFFFPVLLLNGALDENYLKIMQLMQEKMPVAQLKTIPDVGHNTHLENLELYTDTITSFISASQ